MLLYDQLRPSAFPGLPNGPVDESLVRRAKMGDQSAYEELYKRHLHRASKVIFRITRNAEDTEDAIQDTFSRAFLRIDSFDGRAQFSTWLTRIAINAALMVLRKRTRRAEQSIEGINDEGTVQTMQLLDPHPDPELIYLRKEEIARLKSAMQGLPTLLREVTTRRCSDDSSIHEIAEATGITVAAAKSRLLRAGIRLRLRLKPAGHRVSKRI